MSFADAHACSTARETAGRSLGSGLERDALRAALVRLEAAQRNALPYELSAALAGVGRCYRRLMALRTAEDSLQQALRWARLVGSPDLEVDLLCELAECACLLAEQLGEEEFRGSHAARERCRDTAFEASVRVRHVADPQWECTTLLRISDVLSRCGDHEDAASLQCRAMGLMSSGGTTHE